MKRVLICLTTVCLLMNWGGVSRAETARLSYRLAPGQVWVGTESSQDEIEMSGKKFVTRTITTIEYKVSKGPKSDWVSLTARILSTRIVGMKIGIENELSGFTFFADMHKSGEIRNIRHEGRALLANAENMTPQMKKQWARSSEMKAKGWERGVFWFPVLPQTPLAPGDEFDDLRRMSREVAMGAKSQTAAKRVFTLVEISDGLAYFDVRQRVATKALGIGGNSGFNMVAKGDSVFDLKAGMWIDLVDRSKIKMTGNQELFQVNKKEMVRKK